MTLHVRARQELPGFTLDVDIEAPGGVTVLFGPSGAGKSTVLAVVAGLRRPDAGRVALDGATLLDTAARIDVPVEKRRCGVVFQDARLLPHLTVESNLRYGARRAPRDAAGPGFDEVVALLGVGALLRRRPHALSGGEKQRVALGRALLSRPRLLLMDEPLAALDGPRKADILALIERLRDEARLPILYVTHDLAEVDRLADTLVVMDRGRVLGAGSLEALTARTDLPVLSARRDAGAVLACTVTGHDGARGLTRLGFPGGALLVPLRPEPPGARLRLRLRARDITLATERPHGLSSLNVLDAVVSGVAAAGEHEAFVSVQAGPATLFARLTRESVDRLALLPGRPVAALLKATAFDLD